MNHSFLPPGQQLAAPGKWPLVGERPPTTVQEPWTVQVEGLVAEPRNWTIKELQRLPTSDREVDIHCVTRWSKLAVRFRGVALADVLARSQPHATARFVSFSARGERNHSTSLPLEDALRMGVFLAFEHEGSPLATEHGGPVRIITPGRYFYKSLKWLRRIELLAEDRLGYWEREAGYHNRADPWREERYMAPTLDRREAARLIARRDFRHHDLRGIDAAHRDLQQLDARDALLRNADFRHARLASARFDHANLSNAHFEHADLRDATFHGADVEGADFAGADLRGADFRGASLFGATFASPLGNADATRVDANTFFDSESLAQLAPPQHQIVASATILPREIRK